ncbi:MAG: hypothetical protein MJ231_06790 [bacterium]|nr:hypothetical protein [bacterium]
MKVQTINYITFNRRLKPSEEKGYIDTLREGKKAIGNTGYSMLIVPQQSLPQSVERNTGVGNLLSKDGIYFQIY